MTIANGHRPGRSDARPRGQILVIFAISIIALRCGMVALVIDVSWYWANSLRVQRAADAAALAGVVWLPGTPRAAYTVAIAEAAQERLHRRRRRDASRRSRTRATTAA